MGSRIDIAVFRTLNSLFLLELIVHSISVFGLITGRNILFAEYEGSGGDGESEKAFREA